MKEFTQLVKFEEQINSRLLIKMDTITVRSVNSLGIDTKSQRLSIKAHLVKLSDALTMEIQKEEQLPQN